MALAEEADGLLVVGTTLTVWSSFRIVKNVAARHAKSEFFGITKWMSMRWML